MNSSELFNLICAKCGDEFISVFPNQRYCWDCRKSKCDYCGNKINLKNRQNSWRVEFGKKNHFCCREHYFLWLHKNKFSENERLKRRRDWDKKRYYQNEKYRIEQLQRNKNNPNKTDHEIKINIGKFIKNGNLKSIPQEIYDLLYVYYLGCKISNYHKKNNKYVEKHKEFGRGWLEREDMYERKCC